MVTSEPQFDSRPAGAAMEGSGFYNRNSGMQAAGIGGLLSIWEQTIARVDPIDRPIVIADYGSSQGRNSMTPMRMAINGLRARAGAAVPIQVVHTDLPENDFTSLFQAIEEDENSYVRNVPGVFPAAIGRSYFDPIFPPDSVLLGWNTWAIHWLSGEKIIPPDHILPIFSQSAQTLAQLRRQQSLDWERFLICRGSELAPGGRLLTAFAVQLPDVTGWERVCGELWHAVNDLVAEGELSSEEVARIAVPAATRRIPDVFLPFGTSGTFGSLHLEHFEVVQVPDPFWATFEASGDVDALGRSQADSLRGWAAPSIASCLKHRKDVTDVIDHLFVRTALRLKHSPQPHRPYLGVAVLKK